MNEREEQEIINLFENTPFLESTPFTHIDQGFFEVTGYEYSREFVAVKDKKAVSIFGSKTGSNVKIEVCDTDVFVVGRGKSFNPITKEQYEESFNQAVKSLSYE